MTALIPHTSLDSNDAYSQSVFWGHELGFAGEPDEELVRLLELDTCTVSDLREPDGSGWVVLADLERNEFCILRSEAERAASSRERPTIGGNWLWSCGPRPTGWC